MAFGIILTMIDICRLAGSTLTVPGIIWMTVARWRQDGSISMASGITWMEAVPWWPDDRKSTGPGTIWRAAVLWLIMNIIADTGWMTMEAGHIRMSHLGNRQREDGGMVMIPAGMHRIRNWELMALNIHLMLRDTWNNSNFWRLWSLRNHFINQDVGCLQFILVSSFHGLISLAFLLQLPFKSRTGFSSLYKTLSIVSLKPFWVHSRRL